MKTAKWATLLFVASALCACDTKKDAATHGEEKAGVKIGASASSAKATEPASHDAEMLELAKKSNCLACHSVEKNVVGPAFKSVAAKYRGDATAEERLIAKVSKGSAGVWGSVPMPANSPAVKDDDIKALVNFVLSLK